MTELMRPAAVGKSMSGITCMPIASVSHKLQATVISLCDYICELNDATLPGMILLTTIPRPALSMQQRTGSPASTNAWRKQLTSQRLQNQREHQQ